MPNKNYVLKVVKIILFDCVIIPYSLVLFRNVLNKYNLYRGATNVYRKAKKKAFRAF